jgi:hypothetical protein
VGQVFPIFRPRAKFNVHWVVQKITPLFFQNFLFIAFDVWEQSEKAGGD